MDDPRNSTDRELLRSDPRGLLLRHQETIGIIVRTYVRTGMFHASEIDDIIQQINKEILEKLPRIQAQFNGTTLVRTYLSSIIRHSCLNLNRKKKAGPVVLSFEDIHAPATSGDIDADLAVEQNLRLLRVIIAQFHTERPKLLLCLKTMYRIPLVRNDILEWWPGCPEADLTAMIAELRSTNKKLTDKQVFALLQPLVNKAEGNASSADSIRRWTDERITAIITLLNGSPPTSTHTKETLGILLDVFFAPFLLQR
jgi:DNA-directed RNA polymerase specialized sigma24 family protein